MAAKIVSIPKEEKDASTKKASKKTTPAKVHVVKKINTDATPNPKTDAKDATPEQFAKAETIILGSKFYALLTAWEKSEIKNFLAQKDHFSFLLATSFELAEDLTEVQAIVDSLIRPEGSFLHITSPCPAAFMQREFLYIDGVNCDLKNLVNNKAFWWQPVRNVPATELAHAIKRFTAACQIGTAVNFCNIQNIEAGKGVKSLMQIMKERTDVNQ